MKRIGAVIVIWVATVSAAGAYCPAPGRAPQPPQSYERPRPPACLANAGYNREHDCAPSELDRYREDVDDYARALQDYADEAHEYAETAERYARCEADDARENLR